MNSWLSAFFGKRKKKKKKWEKRRNLYFARTALMHASVGQVARVNRMACVDHVPCVVQCCDVPIIDDGQCVDHVPRVDHRRGAV